MAFASLFIRTTSRGVAMTVTVFTKPHCPQCDATKRQLTKLGVPFETVDLTQNPMVTGISTIWPEATCLSAPMDTV